MYLSTAKEKKGETYSGIYLICMYNVNLNINLGIYPESRDLPVIFLKPHFQMYSEVYLELLRQNLCYQHRHRAIIHQSKVCVSDWSRHSSTRLNLGISSLRTNHQRHQSRIITHIRYILDLRFVEYIFIVYYTSL